ncbi:MAG: hypothetical protein IJ091_04345 [Oscillospiraceae bacterium]|nr:hypothetical protein [Oscillospiraceae bacterium]
MRKNRLLIILFLSVLVLPVLLYPFLSPYMDTENYENRTLAEFPSLKDGTSFLDGFTVWFNDHLPYKNQMVSLHSNLFLSLFNATPNPRVVVGEDGWLYYNNYDAENPIDDILGRSAFSAEEMGRIQKNLSEAGASLGERDISFVFLLAPNKESIYREHLPEYLLSVAVPETRADVLVSGLSEDEFVLVYPRDALLYGKDNWQLYYRYDTHWNKLGAYIGFREICERLGIVLPELESLTVTEKEGYPRDLSDLAGIGNRCTDDSDYEISDLYPEVTWDMEKENGATIYRSNAEDPRSVLIVHDSYYRSMTDYFPKVFSTVISVDRDYGDLYSVHELIDLYEPDIVVMEVVERGIQILLHDNMPY